MIYREYGNTGKKVSVIGFGGMRFQNPENIDESAHLVMAAAEQGINYFDTAPGYCNDKSEIIMGQAFREMQRRGLPFYVSTKSIKADATELRKDLETSLTRLNVEAIDFYNCWQVLTLEDWESRKAGGAVREMLRAKEEGLIKHAVFSTHLPGAEIRKVIAEGYFEGVTLGYSAINFPYREEGIKAAVERELGVVVMNPLGGGTLMENEQAFAFLKVREEQSMLEAALHFLLSQKEISVNLVGFRNSDDLAGVRAAVEAFIPYSAEEISAIRNLITSDFNSLCTTCMYCKNCPQGIEIWKFVETSNHLTLKGGWNPVARLESYWGTNLKELERCTECRVCEALCTQKLPILERFKKLKRSCRLFARTQITP